MAINIHTDELLTFKEAAERWGLTYASVHKYATKGWHGVLLESLSFGGAFRTSPDAMDEFVRECDRVRRAELRASERAREEERKRAARKAAKRAPVVVDTPHGSEEVPS